MLELGEVDVLLDALVLGAELGEAALGVDCIVMGGRKQSVGGLSGR